MAVKAFSATQGANFGNGTFGSSAYGASDPVAALAAQAALLATAKTASTAVVTAAVDVTAAVAVLVADGALPTQAHVNTLNTAYGVLATAITASNTATQAITLTALTTAFAGNVTLLIDTAVVTSTNGIKSILKSILTAVAGCGLFTP